ncbi:M10 family metallopeptidase C-terminal domain-containing protein [Methylobacterium oryzisoli]|uniref:M10 family metallopeptidase C-terminal domain-containing protein n=1 Tax=Methylobacterium oryzisoli TaxID=3385502 RepID=UPI00389209DB
MSVLTAAQKAAGRAVMEEIAAVSGLAFTEIDETSTTHAAIRMANSTAPSTSYAWLPGSGSASGDAFFGNVKASTPVPGTYAYHTYLHEIGHTLGLKHGQDTGTFGAISAPMDSMEFSVMTYRSYVSAPLNGYTNEYAGYAQSLMMLDIAALQHLYRADYNTNSGDSVYSFDPATGEMSINGVSQGEVAGNRVFRTIWDGGGRDTYDFSNYDTDQSIELGAGSGSRTSTAQLANLGGTYARANVFNALLYNENLGSLIENAIGGSGNDAITGNQIANVLQGGNGDDTLDGGLGDDTIVGGAGVNALYGRAGDDTAVFDFSLTEASVGLQNGVTAVSASHITALLSGFEHYAFADGQIDTWDGAPLVDDLFYAIENKDVFRAGIDADPHYMQVGWREGRNPNAYFDTAAYLQANPDVAAAGLSPLDHYAASGWREGRNPSPRFDTDLYLRQNPDVDAAGINPLLHYLLTGYDEGRQAPASGSMTSSDVATFHFRFADAMVSYDAAGQVSIDGPDGSHAVLAPGQVGVYRFQDGIIDTTHVGARELVDDLYYYAQNKDVWTAGLDAAAHYYASGWIEGRDPNAYFDTSGYLAAYEDVAAAGLNPLVHYDASGWKEGRDPSGSFDTRHYLSQNPDVAAANLDPLLHFLISGQNEGRAAFADGEFAQP